MLPRQMSADGSTEVECGVRNVLFNSVIVAFNKYEEWVINMGHNISTFFFVLLLQNGLIHLKGWKQMYSCYFQREKNLCFKEVIK